MIRPVASTELSRVRKAPLAFILFEVLLVLAIPAIGYLGAQSLLDTRAGEYVTQPTASDPGWLATVDPSPVTALVAVLDGQVTGVAIVAQQRASEPGGAIVLLPPTLQINGVELSAMQPALVAPAVASALRMQYSTVSILDEERWLQVLGEHSVTIENPDPVLDAQGEQILAVGSVEVDAGLVAAFIGQPAAGGNVDAIIVRRELWWDAILASPPSGDDEVAVLLGAVGAGTHDVVELATVLDSAGARVLDIEEAERVLTSYVPFPIGVNPGDRLQVRVLARSADLDLEAVARFLTKEGFEVVQIGNAETFDDGAAQVLVPVGVTDERVEELAQLYSADTVRPTEVTELVETVTLVVGSSTVETSTP